MVWYKTKKGILGRMGRHEKNVRALDRAIKRGEVIEYNWMWGYKLDILSETVNKLDAEVKELKKSEFQWWDLEEAKAQWEYWEAKCREYWRKMNLMVEIVYDIIKPKLGNKLEPFSEFKEAIFEKVRDLDDD